MEVKKTRTIEKQKKGKKRTKKLLQSREVGTGQESDILKEEETKEIPEPASDPPRSRKTSKPRYKSSAHYSIKESPRSRALQLKEFHLEAPLGIVLPF